MSLPKLWSGQDMAIILGISPRHLRSLVETEVITPTLVTEGGKRVRRYEPVETNKAYRDYKIKAAVEKATRGLNSETDMDMATLKQQKLAAETKLKEAQLENQQFTNALNSGKLVRVETVEEDYKRFFVELKRFVLAIPSRVTGMLAGAVDAQETRRISAELTKEAKQVLESFVLGAHEEKNLDAT